MADLSLINEQRNPTDMWLKGILTSKSADDFNPGDLKSHLDNFSLDDNLTEKDDLPNAMEFVSVECNMLFDSDFNLSNEHRVEEKSVRKKKHKNKKSKHSKSSKKNSLLPLLYPVPLISELFRYRSVDVYKRSNKDGPFVKVFTSSEAGSEKNKPDVDESIQNEEFCEEVSNVKKVKEPECDVCGRQLLVQDLETHLQQEHMEGNLYKCEVCHKRFREKKYLITHRISHVNVVGRPYPCPLCQERFSNKTALKTHLHSHSSGKIPRPDVYIQNSPPPSRTTYSEQNQGNKKEFQCQHCQKSFTYKVQCTSHEKLHSPSVNAKFENSDGTLSIKQIGTDQRKHSKGKPYQCDKCSAAFRARSSLWSHKKSHIGQKPRECPDCGLLFWKSSALKKHKKSHHDCI